MWKDLHLTRFGKKREDEIVDLQHIYSSVRDVGLFQLDSRQKDLIYGNHQVLMVEANTERSATRMMLGWSVWSQIPLLAL